MGQIFFVYLLTFANGKVYVGMSRTDAKGGFTNRWRQHVRAAREGKDLPLYRAWRKHGAPGMSIVSMHATRDECAVAEIDEIQKRRALEAPHGYNLMPGGQGMHVPPGSPIYDLMRAKVWDHPERRRKSSEALKGRPVSDATREAHAAYMATPDAKEFIASVSRRPDVRAKASATMQRRLANGFREHLSVVQVGKPKKLSPEEKARLDAARKAWAASDEGKAVSRANIKRILADPENAAKRRTAHAAYLHSDANADRCRRNAAKARRPVKDVATGQEFPSIREAANAYGVAGPTVLYWIKKGKFARV